MNELCARIQATLDDEPESFDRLVREIRSGRCVAFVGAGVSMGEGGAPTWKVLLQRLAGREELSQEARASLTEWSHKEGASSAFELEALGQRLKDELGEHFPTAIKEAVRIRPEVLEQTKPGSLGRRRKLLREIPFAAILTTNYDNLLDDDAPPTTGVEAELANHGYHPGQAYEDVLRAPAGWWRHLDWTRQQLEPRPRILKLHGHAFGADANPVVLARQDYRRLLYQDSRYGSFLRAVLATRTVLFVGVSFTDAYLNELRSEVLALADARSPASTAPGHPRSDPPWFAIMPNLTKEHIRYYENTEGICVLPYPADGDDHSGCDAWLERLWNNTAPVQRLRNLLNAQRDSATDPPLVLWCDPNRRGNVFGEGVFQHVEAEVQFLNSPNKLDETKHGSATLLVCRYGHQPGRDPDALEVLRRVNQWSLRPPVIVFSQGGPYSAANRSRCLRQGAFEFAVTWEALFESVERLLGPLPSDAALLIDRASPPTPQRTDHPQPPSERQDPSSKTTSPANGESLLPFHDRAVAAFLGLALGDAYGRPLEFQRGPQVRTLPVDTSNPAFRWTDDTHMSIYLARALLDLGPEPLDEDTFGSRVGEHFSEWLEDPLTPKTAPGNTCMAGVRAWRQTRNWRLSGVSETDGCGAIMRVCPLAISLAGHELTRAAEVSAALTHGHPNAIEAAIAASHLLRKVLEHGRVDAGMVEDVLLQLRGPWSRSGGGTTALALEAALSLAQRDDEWLDEGSVPPGDGGWRSSSALGLAVTAALRWGHDFKLAVDKAARIDGDSDSVACLTGMLLGGAGGREVLPNAWTDALPRYDHLDDLEDLAKRLADRGQPLVAVADVHGHRERLQALIAHLDAQYGDAYRLVLLGDYCDNGPDVRGLLEFLVQLRQERGGRLVAILGNHDLACLCTLGSPDGSPDEGWYANWQHYWNGSEQGTPWAYKANSAASFARSIPLTHREFLERLPWYAETARYFFVHAGLLPQPIGPQRQLLERKHFPREEPANAGREEAKYWLIPQLRDKQMVAVVNSAEWDKVVVSGHTKKPAEHAPADLRNDDPHFLASRRICLSADVDAGGSLWAIRLPQRELVAVDPGGAISTRPASGLGADTQSAKPPTLADMVAALNERVRELLERVGASFQHDTTDSGALMIKTPKNEPARSLLTALAHQTGDSVAEGPHKLRLAVHYPQIPLLKATAP